MPSLDAHHHDLHGYNAHRHHHHHDEPAERDPHRSSGWTGWLRYLIAATVTAVAVISACAVLVGPSEAVVVTRFGDPVRVLVRPGLTWRLPSPIEGTTKVDLRLRTTSSGLPSPQVERCQDLVIRRGRGVGHVGLVECVLCLLTEVLVVDVDH